LTRRDLHDLLGRVQSGSLTPEAAHERILQYLRQSPFEDLGFARLDHHRAIRQGFPEVIFGLGKTPEQIAALARRLTETGQALLVTRTDLSAYAAVAAEIPDAIFNPTARTISRPSPTTARGTGTILIASAGTADLPIAEEAAISAEIMGNDVDRLFDVGVAGLHRLLAEHARLLSARIIIVVAGMEGALPSVVGGLVSVPVIAVPTSIGYGASFGGVAALLGMLNSCASGLSVVNIDNGFGAAAVASAINHLPDPPLRA
jgi:pyridinium-3,5-biscarboxylic acid mononucleotide synthase